VTPRTGDFACSTLAVEVEMPEPIGSTLLLNHNPSWQLAFARERELQAVAATRFADEMRAGRDMHVLVAGDFDTDPIASSIRFRTGP
jgi:hypothetical protein